MQHVDYSTYKGKAAGHIGVGLTLLKLQSGHHLLVWSISCKLLIVQEEKYKLLAYFFKDSAKRDMYSMHGAFKFFITKLV